MSATHVLPEPVASEALPRKRFTRDEVDRLAEAGFFVGQRYELIDGDLIDKMGQNPPHATGIGRALEWLASFLGIRRIRVQQPMEAAPADRERSLPEPDLAVLAEAKPDYNFRHPAGDEVLLVVEVADTSAAFDRSRKALLYAKAGAREYWVLDVARRNLVLYRHTDGSQYRSIQILAENDLVSMEGRTESVQVKTLLPERSA